MNIEYTAIVIGSDRNPISNGGVDELRDWFSRGWEYVDSISQSVAITSSSYNREIGDVIVILKKNKGVAL